MSLPLLGLWLALAGPVVRVEGDTLCPTGPEVIARVSELLPGSTAAGEPDLLTLADDGGDLNITLQRPDGRVVGQRSLPRTSSCTDLAAAAAVVIAVWESNVHPEFALRIDPPAGTKTAASDVAVSPPATVPPPPGMFDVGAALFGALAPTSAGANAAGGAMLEASWTSSAGGPRARWGIRAALAAGTERALDLPSGTARWRRVPLAAGPQLRLFPSRQLVLDLHAEALVAWLSLQGVGFAANRPSSSFEPGVGVGARLVLRRGRIVPWLEVIVNGWLREQVAFERPSNASASLPRIEGFLALGVSYCACR